MNVKIPEPQGGYLPREYLGGGRWKKAFRAVSKLEMKDVALLVYEDQEQRSEMRNDFGTLLTIQGTKYCEYVATPLSFICGEDGRFYFVEELLYTSLDKLAPVKSGEVFVRIARDLCRGLQCLHAAGLMHRDIKLDNCGLDHSGRAKIFDLGNVTSNEGPVKGTIFTRAPELFKKDEKHTKACDVWSLGATLFALRTNKYPFVERHEIVARQRIADEARDGRLSENDENQRKADMDSIIRDRYARTENIRELIITEFPGRPGDILCEMLCFDSEARLSAERCAESWEQLLLEWINPSGMPVENNTELRLLSSLEGYLTAVHDGHISITNRQWDKVSNAWDRAKRGQGRLDADRYSRLENLMNKVKMLRGRDLARLQR